MAGSSSAVKHYCCSAVQCGTTAAVKCGTTAAVQCGTKITIDTTVRHIEDKVKNLGVIFDSRLSFEHHIKSLCSLLNGTLSYLNRVKNMLDQKPRILLINALIFSHLNYCSSIWGKYSEKLQYEVQKCINFAAKVASKGKYLKRDHVTPLLYET